MFLFYLTYAMKKTLLSLAGIMASSAILFWTANAQLEISDLFYDGVPQVEGAHTKLLNDYENSRWYSDSTDISCEVNNGVAISTPAVDDSTMDKANVYNLFISPYRVDQIKSWDPSVDVSKIIMKKVELNDADGNVRFEISDGEIDSSKAYYGFISPADMFDVVWIPSSEICFKLDSNMCLQGTACDGLSSESNTVFWWEVSDHSASCAWMDLANVTHTENGDTITLEWTAVDWDIVEIAIFDKDADVYKSLWTANMSDGKFEYKMQWDGEQNFMLTNGCKEVKIKFDAKRWEKESEIKVTPATWPAENVLYVAIAAIVLYGAYVLFFRKSDNN